MAEDILEDAEIGFLMNWAGHGMDKPAVGCLSAADE
jgi:hypothetical protein